MRFYLSYFKLRFISGLQYRIAALAGLSTQFFFGFVYMMVYAAFYETKANGEIIEFNQLVSYLWLGQAFFALINTFYKDKEIINMIINGNIAYELVRPKSVYFMWFSKILGTKLSSVILRCFPVLFIALLLPKPYNLSLPDSFLSFILFLIALLIGALLVSAIVTFAHVLILLTLNEKGIVNIFTSTADLLSGMVVPLPLFPLFLQKISNFLPFKYISDLSFRIYSGNIGITDGIFGIFIQIIWLFIVIVIGLLLTKKCLKRAVVQGG